MTSKTILVLLAGLAGCSSSVGPEAPRGESQAVAADAGATQGAAPVLAAPTAPTDDAGAPSLVLGPACDPAGASAECAALPRRPLTFYQDDAGPVVVDGRNYDEDAGAPFYTCQGVHTGAANGDQLDVFGHCAMPCSDALAQERCLAVGGICARPNGTACAGGVGEVCRPD